MKIHASLVLASVTLGLVCVTGTASEQPSTLFHHHNGLTGLNAHHQTIVSGFFRDRQTADIAVIHVAENNQRKLRLFGFDDGEWNPVLDAALRPGTRFVDVARIHGRDRLITYEAGRLSWFDPANATVNKLIEVTTTYNPNPKPSEVLEVQRLDITQDLNGDGRDDILIPDIDGFWVSIQLNDGALTTPVKIGPPEPYIDAAAGLTVETLPWYLSRVHRLDYNGDGLCDLVFWQKDHFNAYLQNSAGTFDPTPNNFTTDIRFDADGVYSHLFAFPDESPLGLLLGFRAKRKRTVLFNMIDMNGDDVADLVTQTIEGRSIVKQRTSYAIHFGKATNDGLVFAEGISAKIHTTGKAGGIQASGYAWHQIEDFDGDGHTDVMLGHVTVSLFGVVRTLTGNSVPINLEIFRGEGGEYPAKPTVRRKIRRFAPFAGIGNIFFPNVMMGDVTGDGRSDLLVGKSPKELQVFIGVGGPELLAKRPQRVDVALPPDERNAWLVDLNGDAKQDILIHNGPTARKPNLPHQLTTLIAR